MNLLFSPMILLLLVLVIIGMGFHVLREYERAVIFRWGRLARGIIGGNGPGGGGTASARHCHRQ